MLPLEENFLWLVIAGFALVIAPVCYSGLITLRANEKKDYSSASRWSKIAMAGGIVFTFVVRWWMNG